MSEEKPRAFVIMQYESMLDKVYDQLIYPALDEAGYQPERADTNLDQVDKVKQAVEKISNAALIVADLTGNRHNVMYELGVAHSLGRPTVMITQSREDLPFYLRGYQVHEYSVDFDEAAQLREYIEQVATNTLGGDVAFGNPVKDALGEHVASTPIAPPLEVGATAPPERSGDEVTEAAKGLFEHGAEVEEAMGRITEKFAGVSDATREYSHKVQQHTANFNQWAEAGSPGGMGKARDMGAAAAQDVFAYANSLEAQAEGLDEDATILAESTPVLIRSAVISEDTREQDCQQLSSLRDSLNDALSTIRGAKSSTVEMRTALPQMKGFHSRMDAAVSSVDRRVGNIVSFMDRYESLTASALDLVEDRLARECSQT